jgi:hypothetical protein
MYMPKKPVSVTLEADNLLWLRGRAAARKRRSLSDALDEIVTAARTSGADARTAKSVVGTIDIAAADPGLERADADVAALFASSVGRPFLVRKAPARETSARKGRRG